MVRLFVPITASKVALKLRSKQACLRDRENATVSFFKKCHFEKLAEDTNLDLSDWHQFLQCHRWGPRLMTQRTQGLAKSVGSTMSAGAAKRRGASPADHDGALAIYAKLA